MRFSVAVQWPRNRSGALMPMTVATLVSTIAVAIGFGDLPYGYYMLLRLLLCAVCLFFVFGANLALADWEKWTCGSFAVRLKRN
jgi:hypothetical protein